MVLNQKEGDLLVDGGLKLAEFGSWSPPVALGSDVAISSVLCAFSGRGGFLWGGNKGAELNSTYIQFFTQSKHYRSGLWRKWTGAVRASKRFKG